MISFLLIGVCIGCLLMITISYIINFQKYPKICKNCNNFVPCVDAIGNLKGACHKCSINTYLFGPNMSCGHFEYTEAIQAQIDKNHLEKCFKK